MHHAYLKLHQQSYAHSIEVWQDNDLVGGVYGVALGKVFFGESMFSSVSNASKVGLVMLCHWLKKKGFVVVDCQVASDHLFSMGAEEIPRSRFLQYLESIVLDQPKRDFATDFEHVNIEDVIKAI